MYANMIELNKAEINGRKAWLYMIDTSIGVFYVAEYENPNLNLTRKIFDGSEEKAKAYFTKSLKLLMKEN